MCSLVSAYLHSRAKMRTVFIYASKVKVKVWFYIALYPVRWTAQSALHFPPLADLFIPAPFSASLGSILPTSDSTLSPLSCFIDLNLNLAIILKLLFGATYFPNRSQYTDHVFDSVSDKSQVLETSMPSSSPDHKSKYFTLTTSVFSARGPSNMSWHIVLNFLNACATSVDAQFIVDADNPAISAMTATQL